ncbi:hypothetical protein I316_04067 [Kwoniella heveanensis BCC8398]|uniref:TPPC8 first Ig-like domain-containing protein n=1 Tax=Kwoniella heveanensis BCC8398 TaxID=1296120 RepID=A0A1B9GSS6_9TREE|nr:hypothetical protein I316_04067 [Kwoniella heveanensis BCC8398]
MPSPPLSIVQSLSPRIAVLQSEDVIQSCEANGCRGLEELLRPWEGGTERVSILSTTLTPTIHPTFPLRFVSYDSVYVNPGLSSPQPDVVVDLIGSFVGAKKPDDEQHYPLTRSLLLSSRPLAGHETFNHPVGILFAVSTATPDPMGTLNQLHAHTVGANGPNVPWMDGSTVLRFYVVVHDVSMMGSDVTPAHELLANVKKAYGPHSTLLMINSQANPSALSQVYASALASLTLSPMAAASASLGDSSVSETPATPSRPPRKKLYGTKLTADDTQRLAALVRELVGQSLVPWMEARVREWNEVYHANRRGITGRLFGAGRKFFGSRPNSPAPGTTPTGYNTVKGYYPTTAVEALSRRLADFAFMLRDYKFAGSVYDSLRKDFAQDRAWRYAAAATEMYGLCLLLSHNYFLPSSPPTMPNTTFTNLQHAEISSWLEQAVTAYHQHAPATQIQLDALRVTVLYYEAWKAIGEWRGVGAALVKGAGEADEVPSAVMIEEAAAADVKGGKSNVGKRRRAFHLVLAARRYETAGLKTYSRRCLERASQIYRDSPWTAAQDRIEYSLGRQAYTLGESDVAVEHFLRLLRREDTGVPGSQGGPLQDMALAYEQLSAHPEQLAASADRLQLPTPVFDVKKTRISTPLGASTAGPSRDRWNDLETQTLNTWDRKGKKPMTLLPDERRISVGVDETFQVQLVATNPLNAPSVLSDLTVTFDPSDNVEVDTIDEVPLEPYETRVISLSVTPTSATTLKLSQVTFLFHRFFPCVQELQRKGRRLHTTKAQKLTPTYAEDTSLTIHVAPSRAILGVDITDIPETVYAGQEVEGSIKIVNRGKVAVQDLRMIWNHPGVISTRAVQNDTKHSDTHNGIPNIIAPNSSVLLHADTVSPGEEANIPIVFSAHQSGPMDLLGLIVFSDANNEDAVSASSLVLYLKVIPVLNVKASVQRTSQRNGEGMIILETMNISSEAVRIEAITGVSPVWIMDSTAVGHEVLPNQIVRSIHPFTYDKAIGDQLDLNQNALITSLGRLIAGQPIDEVSTELERTMPLASTALRGEALRSYLSSRRLHRLAQLHSAFPTIHSRSLGTLFQLVEPLDLDILISYSVLSESASNSESEDRRQGTLALHSIRPSPSFSLVDGLKKEVDLAIASGSKSVRTMYEETSRLRQVLMDSVLEGTLSVEEDPVVVALKAAQRGRVVHDFSQGPIKVPVIFSIRNQSPVLPVRYILNLPPPSTSTKSGSGTTHTPASYIGDLSVRGQLDPAEACERQCEIWVNEPCLVNLGGWELLVETGVPLSEEQTTQSQGQTQDVNGQAQINDAWQARRRWSRIGREKLLEVRNEVRS